MRLKDIRKRQAEIKSALDDLEMIESPSEEDALRTDALIQEFDELQAESAPLQERADAVARVRAQIQQEVANGETGTGFAPAGETTDTSGTATGLRSSGPAFNRNLDPFSDLDGVRTGMVPPAQIRGRAKAAVDRFASRSDIFSLSDDGAQEVYRKLEKMGEQFGTSFARQLLSTGSPEYLQAFQSYLNDPTGFSSRAALSLTAANGGYLVPFSLDPTIILTNNGAANPYRDNAQVKTTTTNDWNGVTSAGVTAEWLAEGTEAADSTPTVGPLKITPQKASAYLFGSYEVLGDSDFAAQLPELLADAKERLEENAFAVGTGVGTPKGIITAGTAVSGGAGSAAGVTAAQVYALQASLGARWRGPNARNVWLAHLNIINALRNIPKFSGSTESIVDDSGPVPTMLGKPLLESTSIVGVNANTNKVLAYADMRQYYIVDRVGMSVVYDPIVLGANRRPTGQGAWYAFWRVGADAAVPTAIRVLQQAT